MRLLFFATLAHLLGGQMLFAQTAPSCTDRSECRQLDFWVGEWDVTRPDGTKVATSRIQEIVGQCIVLEHYTEPGGYEGQSMNFYDWALRKWRQTWADSTGGVSEFSGEFLDGAMRLGGETHLADGKRILRRMVLSIVGKDRVRQYSERSTDEGKTWTPAYDFIYIRRNAPAEKPSH